MKGVLKRFGGFGVTGNSNPSSFPQEEQKAKSNEEKSKGSSLSLSTKIQDDDFSRINELDRVLGEGFNFSDPLVHMVRDYEHVNPFEDLYFKVMSDLKIQKKDRPDPIKQDFAKKFGELLSNSKIALLSDELFKINFKRFILNIWLI